MDEGKLLNEFRKNFESLQPVFEVIVWTYSSRLNILTHGYSSMQYSLSSVFHSNTDSTWQLGEVVVRYYLMAIK